jgi:TATA-box binding protein (TBP) (component of TFIID and TFIIIB)
MALCQNRYKFLRACGEDIPLVCINAQCTFSLGDIVIDLATFIAHNPHIPMKLNLRCFAAGFHTASRTIEQQRRYMATKIDPFNVLPENSHWLRETNSNATILLFSHGKVVVTGAKDEASAKLAAHQFCCMLNEHTTLCVQMSDFMTCNQVVCFNVPFRINLASLKQMPEITKHVKYMPERFPLATFHCQEGEQPPSVYTMQGRIPDDILALYVAEDNGDQVASGNEHRSKRAALISPSGPVIVTGACDLNDAKYYMWRIFPFLLMHRADDNMDLNTGASNLSTTDVAEVLTHVVWRTTYREGSKYADGKECVKLGKRSHAEAPRNVFSDNSLTVLADAAARVDTSEQLEVLELFQHIIRESMNTRNDDEPLRPRKKVRAIGAHTPHVSSASEYEDDELDEHAAQISEAISWIQEVDD